MVRATTLKRIPYYADSVAQAFVECVEEGALEDIQAMWYLELVRNMHESGADIAAYNILNGVFYYAESPAALGMSALFNHLVEASRLDEFLTAFLDNDYIDDYLMELTIHKALIDAGGKPLS
jgi:hypothetical protein